MCKGRTQQYCNSVKCTLYILPFYGSYRFNSKVQVFQIELQFLRSCKCKHNASTKITVFCLLNLYKRYETHIFHLAKYYSTCWFLTKLPRPWFLYDHVSLSKNLQLLRIGHGYMSHFVASSSPLRLTLVALRRLFFTLSCLFVAFFYTMVVIS